MVLATVEVSDEAVRRWHELAERRAALAATRCSCGCRCDAGRPRPGTRPSMRPTARAPARRRPA